MTLTLIQKLLISIATLTAFYLIFIKMLYHDLTRPIGRSIFQIIPSFAILAFGFAISYVLSNPSLIFSTILPLKSGFAKGVLSTTVLPLIAASVRVMSIIACLTALIDKFWFYWRNYRIIYVARLASAIGMTVIAGNTLLKIIFADQKALLANITYLNKVTWWLSVSLGTLLAIIVLLAFPKIMKRSEQ